MKSQHLNLITYISKLSLYTIPNPIQEIKLWTQLILKMRRMNSNTNTFTKMTTNDRMNTIHFTHVTIDIQSEQKATSYTNDHSNVETISNLATINKITNNKTINNQTTKDHNHPPSEKLIHLLNNAGTPWCDNTDLKNKIKSVTENCSTCQVYRKTSPRPIVGVPTTSNFQETVAMGLKFRHGKILLHVIDHCTQLSASTVVSNKTPDKIIKAIFKIWISFYGLAEKFLTDNRGEFANNNFIQLCKNFGITVKTSAAESPWNIKVTVTFTLLLLGPSILKILSVISMDSHLTNYQLAPTQNYHLKRQR